MKTMLALALVFALSGCVGMIPSEQPATPSQSIATAELTLNGVKRAHANLITTGRVTKEIDAKLFAEETKADDILKTAKAAVAIGDIAASKRQLEAMQTILIELNKRIAELEAQQ